MNAFTRIRANAVGAAVTFSVIALCVGATPAVGSPPHSERLPLQLLNSFPLSPPGQAVPKATGPSTGSGSRRASPVRRSSGSRPPAHRGVSAVMIAVVAAAVLLLSLAGALAVARRRARRGAVRLLPPAPGAPEAIRFNRLRHTDPQRSREGGGAWDVAFRAALVHEEQGDLLRAEKAYRDAAKRGHLAAACNLGVLLHHRGEIDAARQQYRRALEGGEPAGAFNLGVLLEQQRDLAGARAAYRLADRGGHPAAASNLGVLLEEDGLVAVAQAAYNRADERGDPKGAVNLGMLLEEHGDLGGAHAAYRRASEYRRATELISSEASGVPRASR